MLHSTTTEYQANPPPLGNHHHMETDILSEQKEEKIAAARQKLKQFKKKEAKKHHNHHEEHEHIVNLNGELNQQQMLTISTEDNGGGGSYLSGRSTPSSTYSASRQPLNVNFQLQPEHHHQQQQHQQQQQQLSPHQQLSMLSPVELSPSQFKEQLQLHVQTIGILVAEKAELHSKLQQATRKVDKKQDECDELSGRLKASRQKITDLEKLIGQLSNTHDSANLAHSHNSTQLEHARNELSSREFLVDELRMRLAEANDTLELKHDEIKKLVTTVQELSSQLELTQLKVRQLTAAAGASEDRTTGGDVVRDAAVDNNLGESEAMRDRNVALEGMLKEMEVKEEENREMARAALDRSQKQIENLVDQINRMSDEREDLFAKLDSYEAQLITAQQQNAQLKLDIEHLHTTAAVVAQQQHHQNTKPTSNSDMTSTVDQYIVKIDLLENEVKYFKQQIDILLKEDMQTRRLLADKEQSTVNLSKLVHEYESEREKYATMLEQTHSDKQTISRALTQNNELKTQLVELQDAFVQVTQQNADLVNRLQAEEYKCKQLQQTNNLPVVPPPSPQQQQQQLELSPDWTDEGVDTGSNKASDEASLLLSKGSSSLMDSIKERLEYLEKENRDLNDYILLTNKQLEDREEEKRNEGNEVALIRKLRQQVESLEAEKSNLYKKTLQNIPIDADSNVAMLSSEQLKNFKLLEEKFNKVMKTNADLSEKNQQLEHMIQQLQFETETIVDYITMYQMERGKLNEKYKVKDELIRSLSTQLQVNKLALLEINNCLNAYIKLCTDVTPLDSEEQSEADVEARVANREQKKDYLLVQIQNLLINVTSNTVAKLNVVSNAIKTEYTSTSSSPLARFPPHQDSNGHVQTVSNGGNDDRPINDNNEFLSADAYERRRQFDLIGIRNFKNETVLCSSCYGDLFVV